MVLNENRRAERRAVMRMRGATFVCSIGAPAPRKAGACDAVAGQAGLAGHWTERYGVVVSEPDTEQPPESG